MFENRDNIIRAGFFLLISLIAACQGENQVSPQESDSDTALASVRKWQIQYTGDLEVGHEVDLFNLDLFDTSLETIDALRKRGVLVICYFSAGTYEEWRTDSGKFPESVLGSELPDWPGERWVDIRQISTLSQIVRDRLDLAVDKGCDGVDPDNMDGYENETGFPISGNDQLVFNKYIAREAHNRGLLIGLKNDLNQIPELVDDFDWVLNEECFSYQECDQLMPFHENGKPVMIIEYDLDPKDFCDQSNQLGFLGLHKNWNLDAYFIDCRQYLSR